MALRYLIETNVLSLWKIKIFLITDLQTIGITCFFLDALVGAPQVSPDTADDAFVDQPQNTTILGAAKFSGKTKNGWSIGVLESMTSKELHR